jgi:hypothetical protein
MDIVWTFVPNPTGSVTLKNEIIWQKIGKNRKIKKMKDTY